MAEAPKTLILEEGMRFSLLTTRCPDCGAERCEPYRPRRLPVGFGDPPRAEARLAPFFLAGGVLAALFIFLLRSL